MRNPQRMGKTLTEQRKMQKEEQGKKRTRKKRARILMKMNSVHLLYHFVLLFPSVDYYELSCKFSY